MSWRLNDMNGAGRWPKPYFITSIDILDDKRHASFIFNVHHNPVRPVPGALGGRLPEIRTLVELIEADPR
jgi:hypothetical protein